MFSIRCLRLSAILLIVASLPRGVEAQKPFDPAKIVGSPSFSSATKPSANPPSMPLWAPAFVQQVERCWNVPVIESGSPTVQVEFTIHLKVDGNLDGPPIPSAFNGPMTPFYKAYQESVRRALIECQPYQLPVDQFDQWKKFNPVFSNAKSAQRSAWPDTPR